MSGSVRVLGCLCLASLLSACGVPDAPQEPHSFVPGNQAHLMPTSFAPRPQAGTVQAQLQYFGGHVIPNVKVVVVFWGSNVDATTQSQIGGFFNTIPASPYVDWLLEYNTNISAMDGSQGTNQQIGRGGLGSTVTITPSVTGTTIDDSQIQSELDAQITAGKLPAPDANTLYMTYFPPGVTITQGGSSSCQAFCAYHNTFTHNSQSTYYGVMPDLGGGCATGCGGDPTVFNDLTICSSHEMTEAITDAEVGLAQGYAKPMAWMDQQNGEIGDICAQNNDSLQGYAVQQEWSNSKGACITTNPSVTPPPTPTPTPPPPTPTPTPAATPTPPGGNGANGGGHGCGCSLDRSAAETPALSLALSLFAGLGIGFSRRRLRVRG